MGTPINLVRNDGGLIPLMCTTLVMNVDRRVVPIPIPFGGGSRLGFDLNLPGATITLEGIIADEDKFSNAGAKKATATIDFDNVLTFSYSGSASFPFPTTDNLQKISGTNPASNATHAISLINKVTGEDGYIFLTRHPTNTTDTTANVTNLDATVTVTSTTLISVGMSVTGTHIPGGTTVASITNATTFELSAAASGGSYTGGTLTFTGFYGHQGYTNSRSWVGTYNTTTSTARTAAQIAADFAALVNLRTSVFGMTAHVINSPNTGGTGTAVRLEQNTAGKAGNTNFPAFSKWPSNGQKPYHSQFDGGVADTSASGYSAGDRVAELYAVLNNSNNGGIGVLLGGIGAVLAEKSQDPLGLDGGFNPLDQKYGDYIIGLQIPFTSKVNSNASLFYMPTGPMQTVDGKSVDNAKPVGTVMKTSGTFEYTGIKGAIANATFTQLGGEPLYSFTINFVPIDWII
tara:strand:- start:1288 stop:2667 length:1380 start_codon:yes stop_codon:yes gene_type:complete